MKISFSKILSSHLLLIHLEGNRPLLRFQLDLIEQSGGNEIIIVVPREYQQQMNLFISSVNEFSLKIDLVYVDDMVESADGLRAVSDRISGDFIILTSDFMTDLSLGTLTEFHRVKAADLTMLFSTGLMDKIVNDDKKRPIIDEENEEVVMMTDDGKVVEKMSALEIDKMISIRKSVLDKCSSNVTIRNDLFDVGKTF